MKNVTVSIILLLCGLFLMVTLNCSVVKADDIEKVQFCLFDSSQTITKTAENTSNNKLPAALITIEDGAFEGTALSNITLQDNVEVIGNSAFANIEKLMAITIPGTVNSISNNTFAGSDNVIVQTATGTYAEYWAQKHGIQHVVVFFFAELKEKASVISILPIIRTEQIKSHWTEKCNAEKKENRTGRPDAEIKLPRYNGNTSEIIQSRYFP